jgi:hypothetical protein
MSQMKKVDNAPILRGNIQADAVMTEGHKGSRAGKKSDFSFESCENKGAMINYLPL